MTINNTTHHDILFNIDSGTYADIKGQQCRTVIPANSSAVVENAMMFLLIVNWNFQLAYLTGSITVTYSADDTTFFANILSLLNGTL